MTRMRYYLLFFLALLALAQSPNIIKFSQVPINVFGFWRLFIASIILLGIHAIHSYSRNKPSKNSTKSNFQKEFLNFKNSQNFIFMIVLGVLFFTHLWTFFFAAKNTKIANAMIIYSVNPLFTALGSFLFFNERFTWKLFFSYLLAFSGILLIFSSGFELHSAQLLGDASALLSAFLFALYALLSKQVRKNVDNSLFASFVYFVTAICFGLVGIYMKQNFTHYTLIDWSTIAASILIPTLLGHALFTFLLNHLSLTKMTLGKLIEPIIASFMAYLVFHEPVQSTAIISFVLIASAILVSSRS